MEINPLTVPSRARLDNRPQGGRSTDTPKAPAIRERIRIAFLIRALDVGGAQRQLMALARSLDQRVFEVTVLTLYRDDALIDDLRGTGVQVISLDKKSRWDLVGFFARLAKECRNLRPHILHSYLPGQNLLAMSLKPYLPGTKVVWGILSSADGRVTSDWLSTLIFRMQSFLSLFADLIIFNSNAGKQSHLVRGVTASRAIVIHNGTDTVRFKPDRRRGLRLRSFWRIPEGALVIGIVGRIDPVKDYATFLQAAAGMARNRPDARFVFVGGGSREYECTLQQLATELGLEKKVVWAGVLVGELPDAYNAMDIYCSSSRSEGTSNVILEAMACGVPCVVTDVGDSRLIVGETGVVVAPRNAQALADGLELMAQRLVHEPHLRAAVRERIVKKIKI